jgi:hypothetical protein
MYILIILGEIVWFIFLFLIMYGFISVIEFLSDDKYKFTQKKKIKIALIIASIDFILEFLI